MLYIINDFDGKKNKTVHIAKSENEVMIFLANEENLKKIKGELKITKVML